MKSKSDNPLDLNNFPHDHIKGGAKQPLAEDTTSPGLKKKKTSGKKDEKGESEKIYECRFCSLRFGKSQALGGHMNRHRQERETETLNRARQIVNQDLASQGAPPLGAHQVTPGYIHQPGHMGDPPLPYRPVYPTRMFPGSPSTVLPRTHPSYMCPSRVVSYPAHAITDCYVGHVLSSNGQYNGYSSGGGPKPNYTCIGAPVGPGIPPGSIGPTRAASDGGAAAGDGSLQSSQEEVFSWVGSTQQRLDGSGFSDLQ